MRRTFIFASTAAAIGLLIPTPPATAQKSCQLSGVKETGCLRRG